jgi:polysaccharide pyruvyl transferase CsaB
MKQILISGYYGFNNIGDEAVLGGLLAGMRAELPEVTPVVLSADPSATSTLHQVTAIPRMSRSQIAVAMRQSSLFLSGGGSLLQDVTSMRSLLYYLGLLWMAQRARVATMVCAQGIGPLTHALSRPLLRHILNHTQSVTVRDAGSAELLQALGVDAPPVEVTADLSFLLSPEETPRLREWWATHLPEHRPLIGVALRPWHTETAPEHYQAIAEALCALARHTGAMLLFLPMQQAVDTPISRELAGWISSESQVLDIALTPREMLAAVARCDFLLAMRLHALIFAVHRARPAFGISYDPKVFDFALSAKLPAPPDWETLDATSLTENLCAAWDVRESLQATARVSAERLTTLARTNLTRIKGLL